MNTTADTGASSRIVVGVTGASGALYARRLVDCLLAGGAEVHLVVSTLGRRLFLDEMGLKQVTAETLIGREDPRLVFHPHADVGDALASGSFHTDGMIICPCSSNTLAQVAAGLGDNLITRAAQVTLKERRRLIIVPRETPLSVLQLENMRRAAEAGMVVLPASPGFYHGVRQVSDLVDFIVARVLDQLGIEHQLTRRWGGS